jgi:hypothetical protein
MIHFERLSEVFYRQEFRSLIKTLFFSNRITQFLSVRERNHACPYQHNKLSLCTAYLHGIGGLNKWSLPRPRECASTIHFIASPILKFEQYTHFQSGRERTNVSQWILGPQG